MVARLKLLPSAFSRVLFHHRLSVDKYHFTQLQAPPCAAGIIGWMVGVLGGLPAPGWMVGVACLGLHLLTLIPGDASFNGGQFRLISKGVWSNGDILAEGVFTREYVCHIWQSRLYRNCTGLEDMCARARLGFTFLKFVEVLSSTPVSGIYKCSANNSLLHTSAW